MRLITTVTHALLLSAVATAASAQAFPGYPGTHLRLDVRVESITHSGDSTRVAYVVSNSATSQEQLSRLTIVTPSPGRGITYPAPRAAWRVWTHVGPTPVVRWTVRDTVTLTPGKSARGLAWTATGLPGVLDARYEGYAEPVDIESLDDDDPRLGARAAEVTSVPLKVVGVVPMIANPTRALLVSRLLDLTRQSCTLGWITDASLCSALNAYLATPSPQLLAYLGRVAADRLRPGVVNENAYWLLRANAEIVRDFVDAPAIR